MNLRNYIDEIPDFPRSGILFRDFCPLLRDPEAWTYAIKQFESFCDQLKPDLIAGIEARGFIIGSSLATSQKLGFLPIRKGGKLAGDTIGIDYELEYGRDRLEIQKNIIVPNTKVLIVDDLLATGGTAKTSSQLVVEAGGNVAGYCFIIELVDLMGRTRLDKNIPIKSLLTY